LSAETNQKVFFRGEKGGGRDRKFLGEAVTVARKPRREKVEKGGRKGAQGSRNGQPNGWTPDISSPEKKAKKTRETPVPKNWTQPKGRLSPKKTVKGGGPLRTGPKRAGSFPSEAEKKGWGGGTLPKSKKGKNYRQKKNTQKRMKNLSQT